MRWPWNRAAPERRDESYTDEVVAAILARSSATAQDDPGATAAVWIAASMFARALASATVAPATLATAALTPPLLALVGRALMLRGECLLVPRIEAGGLALDVASHWTVTGRPEPATWRYRVTRPGPSITLSTDLPTEAVAHLRINCDAARPWRGQSPLRGPSVSAAMLAHVEQRLSEETTAQVGTLLPHPDSAKPEQIDAIAEQIAALRGRVALTPSMAGGWEEGGPAPKGDWKAERLGANPPQTIPALRMDAHRAILAAGGINSQALLEAAPGNAAREAWRQYATGFVAPIAREIAAQLAATLETPGLAFGLDALGGNVGADIASRARAVAALVNAGATLDSAAAAVGFDGLAMQPPAPGGGE